MEMILTTEHKQFLQLLTGKNVLAQDDKGRWFLNTKRIPKKTPQALYDAGYLRSYGGLRLLSESGKEIVREIEE